jgi:TRAP-type C4-dicarboxylate transport system permease large subunit
MQLTIFVLDTFMETVSIIMICIPFFMPIVRMLGFNPVWFGILMRINLEMGMTPRPFGVMLFCDEGCGAAKRHDQRYLLCCFTLYPM